MRLKNTINSDEESESAFVSKLTIANAALKSSSKVVLVKSFKFLCILVTLTRVEGDIVNDHHAQSFELGFLKNNNQVDLFYKY